MKFILLLLLHSITFVSTDYKNDYQRDDPLVTHISHKDFKGKVLSGPWFIFFGANWCPHCMKLTPIWLQLENAVLANASLNTFHVAKVECTKNQDFCDDEKIAAFPELRVYFDGIFVESYDAAIKKKTGGHAKMELDALLSYVQEKFESYTNGSFVNTIADNSVRPLEEGAIKSTVENAIKSTVENQVKQPLNQPIEMSQREKLLQLHFDLLEKQQKEKSDGLLNVNEPIALTDASFADLVKTGTWMIKFYAPWCSHCKQMAPIWRAFASVMKSKINVGQVDCTVQTKTCKIHGIRGYPTLKTFQKGVPTEYRGDRTVTALKEFGEKLIKDPFELFYADTLSLIQAEKEVFFVYVYDASNPFYASPLTSFIKITRELRAETAFYISPDQQVKSLWQLGNEDVPRLVCIKDYGQQIVPYSGPLDDSEWVRSQVIEWIRWIQHPLMVELTAQNAPQLLTSQTLLIVLIVPFEHHEWIDAVKSVARSINPQNDYKFVWLNGVRWSGYVQRVYGLSAAQLPRLLILDPSLETFYDLDAQNQVILPSSLVKTLDQLGNNTLSPKYTNGFLSALFTRFQRFMGPILDYFIEYPIQAIVFMGILLFIVVFMNDFCFKPFSDTTKRDPKME